MGSIMAIAIVLVQAIAPTQDPYVEALFTEVTTSCIRYGSHDIGPEKKAIVRGQLAIEGELGFPDDARGLIPGAGCAESGWTTDAKGDSKTILSGKEPLVIWQSWGIVQFQRWAMKGVRRWQGKVGSLTSPSQDPRLDWRASSYYWGERFMRNYKRVKGFCKFLPYHWGGGPSLSSPGRERKRLEKKALYGSREMLVIASANATAVRAPKCVEWVVEGGKGYCKKAVPRCHEVTLHYREMKKWKDRISVRVAQKQSR